MDFSLSFFSSTDAAVRADKYAQLKECAAFADCHGFTAIWTPERHFHAFGGIFPNPSLMGVLLATVTEETRVRAGSIVLPLHHPIRVVEEWSVVDNLSGGRVDVSFATGWHPDDFVLSPARHADRLQSTLDTIETVRRLWRGDAFTGRNGVGDVVSVTLHPTPVQRELPVWLTCTGRPERFEQAGERGYNVLTALIFQSTRDLEARIAEYRAARHRAGHDPETGVVTLMLHTFLSDTVERARAAVHDPMTSYLRSSVDLWRKDEKRLTKLTERADALEFAFARYFEAGGLFGTIDGCQERVEKLRTIGVNEIACLVDFGVEPSAVPDSLERLAVLKERCAAPTG